MSGPARVVLRDSAVFTIILKSRVRPHLSLIIYHAMPILPQPARLWTRGRWSWVVLISQSLVCNPVRVGIWGKLLFSVANAACHNI